MNGVYLNANLVKAPESFEYTKDKEKRQGLRLTVAHNHGKDSVSYFDVTYFGTDKAVESMIANLAKGSRVFISGRLQQERWEKDGEKHSKVSIIADEVSFFVAKGDSGE